MSDLGPEPHPQSTPPDNPRGAIDGRTRAKIAVALLLGMMALMGVWFYISHATNKPQGPRQVLASANTTKRPDPYACPDAYHRGYVDAMNRRPGDLAEIPPACVADYQKGFVDGTNRLRVVSDDGIEHKDPAPAPVAAANKPKTLAELDHDAAFAENVVAVRDTASSFSLKGGSEESNKLPELRPATATDGGSSISPRRDPSLPAGTIIEASLMNKLEGEFTGPVIVQVSTDVRNPATQQIVIPQGAKVIGEASRVGEQNQQRLAVTFHRALWYDDASQLHSISLDELGEDQEGAAGLKDKVNNHYFQTFGVSLAIGAISGLSQIGSGNYGGLTGYDAATEFRNGISQGFGNTSQQMLSRLLNRLPTITIRPGTLVRIILTKDLP